MRSLFVPIALLLGAIATSPSNATVLPDGTYRYTISVGGHGVGNSTIVVHRDGAVIVVEERADVPGLNVTSVRKLEESTFATLSYTVDTAAARAVVTVAGNEATLTQGKISKKISAAPDAPFLVSDNLVAAWAQTPAALHAGGGEKLTLACVCGGGFLAVPLRVTSGGIGTLSVHGADGVDATLAFDPHSYVLERLDVASQQASVVLQSQSSQVLPLPQPTAATPVPLPAARYASRDVSIRAGDGVTLAGTLSMPDAAAAAVPAFVFVHGSGCIDRDETIGPNKVFAQLANALSNGGYAVLRYDKRSCGKSGGTFATRDRLIADAHDAIAYLRAQPGIDPSRIFVLGHSEGGELAPSIAIADGRLRGIVLLAPPALPLEQVLFKQLIRDVPAGQRAAAEKRARAYIAAVATGKRTDAFAVWLRSSFGVDPAKLIGAVPCPILIVQGTKDIQVFAADTPRLVEAARSANRKLTVVMLPDDDHLFIKLEPAEASTGVEYYTPSYLDPALFSAIESWLNIKT
ncbi:MAG: alpha/beta fold hydrolase [Candidatus Cybelea sp.]